MKKYLFILGILLSPIVSNAGYNQDFWYCTSVGNMNKEYTVFFTKVWGDYHKNHYKKRQSMFAKHVQKLTEKKFRPSFECKCRDYVSSHRAEKHLQEDIKTSINRNFRTIILDWEYNPNEK